MTFIGRTLTSVGNTVSVLQGPIERFAARWRESRTAPVDVPSDVQVPPSDPTISAIESSLTVAIPPHVADLNATLPQGSLREIVAAVLENPDFKALVAACMAWPNNSTVTPAERSLMIWIIKATKAKYVLEIGTYFAGTTFALASAVASVGGGEVHTIDPYGAERAPKFFAEFPPELASLIRFRAVYSCEFLLMMNMVPPFDLIFIDGSHAYPSVMHDICGSALNAARGGYICIDNAEQPEVLAAARDYLTLNPAVESVLISTNAAARFVAEDVYAGPTLEFAYILLRLPRTVSIGTAPISYHLFNLSVRRFDSVRVSFNAADRGRLKIDYHLRSIHRDPEIEQSFDLIENHAVDVAEGPGDISLPLKLTLAEKTEGQVNFAEFSVSFIGTVPGSKIHDIRLFLDDREFQPGRNLHSN